MSREHLSFPETLPIPDEVLVIARELERAGYETWCVGGAVRDNLLHFQNSDFDLATAAPPDVVQRLFRHTIPVGVEHGTVAVLDHRRRAHEVTTFRRDVRADGRHAVVEFGVSLEEDLARRDFTINAIAYHPFRIEWRDPFSGIADLERRLVRAVGDPTLRFREDYLRILRAVRFASRFGFEIDKETWRAAKASSDGLRFLSAERVREEWFKALAAARKPSQVAQLWRESGASALWLPELESPDWSRRVAALDRFKSPDPVLMTTYLSASPAATLVRLRCSNADISRAERIGEHREQQVDARNEVAVRKWLAEVGEAADDLLVLSQVDDPSSAAPLAAAVSRVRASGAPLRLSDLAVTGNDLLAAGIPAGKTVGTVLRRLLDEVLEDPAKNTRDELLKLARS